MLPKNLGEQYNPLYFLASLGNGGLSVSFFMYLMFMVPHPGTPMPTFEDIYPVLTGGNKMAAGLVGIAMILILYFAFHHIRLLIWNVNEYRLFRHTEAFQKLKKSNAEVTLMAVPLTLAMTINVMFVMGAAFIPGLWNVVEYLFPFALLGFLAVGIYAMRIFFVYFSRLIINGDFDFINNNNLSQMLAIFAFSMVAVGFAAPAAMSGQTLIYASGMFLSLFFGIMAVLMAVVKLVLGFESIFKQGIAKETSPTLWIIIPIVSLLGITFVRLYMGYHHHIAHTEPTPSILFVILSILVSMQIMFGVLGYIVLKKLGYFDKFVYGDQKSVGSYALICPGVAFFVLGMFFISWGLVKNGIVDLFSIPYFVILVPFIFIQFKTIQVMFKLNKKHFTKISGQVQQPSVKQQNA
ncbi:MAG: hypothetical protein H0Z33_05755 [Bacillaceae bacterium]|nr:hypothetical protein [Bacillaceae bacterium]